MSLREIEIELEGGAYVYGLYPKSIGSPDNILIAPGLMETSNRILGVDGVLRETVRELAILGHRGLAVTQSRRDLVSSAKENYMGGNERAEILAEVVEDLGLNKVTLVGSSAGALDAIVAAKNYPNLFDSLLLFHAAGMVDNDSTQGLVWRFGVQAVENVLDTINPRESIEDRLEHLKQLGRYCVHVPAYIANLAKTISELQITAKSKFTLEDLRELTIPIGIIHSRRDNVFPLERVNVHFKDVKYWDSDSNGRHPELWLDPTTSARRIDKAIASLRAFK